MSPDKKEKISDIIAEIFKLDSPGINEQREPKISEFITSVVNGDSPVSHLVINANVDTNQIGAIVYIITNLRLIKIDISSNPDSIKSSSYPLNTLIGVNRKLIGDEVEFSASFQNGSFGLRYSQDLSNISDFFQNIEPVGNN